VSFQSACRLFRLVQRPVNDKLKIIGGQWRRRIVPVADVPGLRPTPARVRETLFNWLQYAVAGKSCLDLFAGSGALGLEAASRGAAKVLQVEKDARACRQLQQNIEALQAQQVTMQQQDVFRFLEMDAVPFDLVFLDPPFGKNMAVACCRHLEARGWLMESAKIYVETEKKIALDKMPDNWQLLKNKTAGAVRYRLYQRLS